MMNRIKDKYEIISHTADLAFKVFGKDREELFANSAFALLDIMFGKLPFQKADELQEKKLVLQSVDLETLIIDWLREIHSLILIEKEVLKEIKLLQIENDSLVSEIFIAKGFVIPKIEIKAITYNDVKIEKKNGILSVIIVCDI